MSATSPALLRQAFAQLRAGQWTQAHDLVQHVDSPQAAWLHGILHIQEGDLEDAENWYDRAGRHFRSRGTLAEELDRWEASLRATLALRSPHQIMADHYAASARGDLGGMLADVAPDVRWTEMAGFPCAGTHVGPAEVLDKVFKVLGSEWDGYRFTLETLLDAGDCIVGLGSYEGTYLQTGKAMSARVAHVWRIEGGLVRSFEQFTDTLLVAQAMR